MKKLLERVIRFIGLNFNFYRIKLDDPRSKYQREQAEKSYNYFSKYFSKSLLSTDEKVREFAIKKSMETSRKEDYFLEFGVYKGSTIKLFASILEKNNFKIYGFDSFIGISEDWLGTNKMKGHYSNAGRIPITKSNVEFVVGDIFETLPKFLNENKNSMNIKFIHIDTDTYAVCKFILESVKKNLDKNAIIVFDELHNFTAWDQGEFRALQEVFGEKEFNYIAFGNKSNAAIKLNL